MKETDTVTVGGLKMTVETLEKARHAKKYLEGRQDLDIGKYEKQFVEIQNRQAYWELLNKKMVDLNMNNIEQNLIKEDFLKQEALLNREK